MNQIGISDCALATMGFAAGSKLRDPDIMQQLEAKVAEREAQGGE